MTGQTLAGVVAPVIDKRLSVSAQIDATTPVGEAEQASHSRGSTFRAWFRQARRERPAEAGATKPG